MKKILVIDDEPDVARIIELTIANDKKGSYAVTTVLRGAEGLKRMEGETFDLLLLDLMMPRMSGREVLDEMAKRRISVPVIVISSIGLPMPIRDELVSRYKIRDLIGKPNVYDLLMPAIHRVLG